MEEQDEKKRPAQKPQKSPRPVKEKPAPRRRERPIDARESFSPADEQDMNAVFRKRLTYLMNGNSALEKPVNIQELADAVGVSRQAIRKYLKPKEKGAPTTPSAATVCAIARFFRTTPSFLLGFDSEDTQAARLAVENEYYNALGLNQRTIDRLRRLRELSAGGPDGDRAAELLSILDHVIRAFAEDAERLLAD